jgi:peptide deformylase
MTTLKYQVRRYGDPVLREKSQPIARVTDEIRTLAKDMIDIMRASTGCGLAAQQIGQTLALCVVEVPPEHDMDEQGLRLNPDVTMPMILINPEITEKSRKTRSHEEGCLSFPDIRGVIVRPFEITVRYLDENGAAQERRLKDFVARVVQHEVDHLNGILFVDRMSAPKRFALSGRLKKMKRETEETLSVRV